MKRFSVGRRTAHGRHMEDTSSRTTTALLLFILVFGVVIASSWIDYTAFSIRKDIEKEMFSSKENIKLSKNIEFPLKCSNGDATQACPSNYPTTFRNGDDDEPSSMSTCPEYFRWIHEDLKPFKATGITREMLERAKRTSHFRAVIVGGKLYVEKIKTSIQTRDVFTLWGISQLLRRYPGMVPDLELFFDCDDRPIIKSDDYRDPSAPPPPPLFHYCGDEGTLDIVFPDWSFWGWAEINIKPWESYMKELIEGNKRTKWMEREPFAYWKGNPIVSTTRMELMQCNVSDKQDWNARLFVQEFLGHLLKVLDLQDWNKEAEQGYKQSDLASQCTYRYKIYIDGSAWSVSDKYILACDSVTLLVRPHYYDFYTRGLEPVHHYWPIRDEDKCRSIKFAVDWGNIHQQKAQDIGKAGSDFIKEELKMDHVYDYMFHLLQEYAKLLKFKPEIPEGAVEFCSEAIACPADGVVKKFMMETMVKSPSMTSPCTMPPHEPQVLESIVRRKDNVMKQVETWEKTYWDSVS